jgi:hypothetical protein
MEEVNLRGINVCTEASNQKRMLVNGKNFTVKAYHLVTCGWQVYICQTCDKDNANDKGDDTPVKDSDNCADDLVPRSPFRTKWICDLIHPIIAKTPSASNVVLKTVLDQYGQLTQCWME